MSATEEGYDRNAALATLSPEERAAIEDDGLSDDDRNALKNIAGDDDGDGADADDGGDDDQDGEDDDAADDGSDDDAGSDADGEGAASGGGGDSGEAASADDQSANDDAENDSEDDAGPIYEASLPADFEDRVAALTAREDDLAAKFKAGDVDGEQFVAETRKIAAERSELDRLRTEVAVADRLNAQNAEHAWMRTVKSFMREVKEREGIDYAGKLLLGSALDIKVKELAANQENQDKPAKWFLKEAHRQVKAELGIGAAVEKKPEGGKPGKPASRKPPTEAMPKTLAHVPGGDGPGDVGGDEFAEIDRLDGEAYEKALAKLTPAQRERYLATA